MPCATKTAITDNELKQVYSNGNTVGILPPNALDASDRDGNGMLTKNTIKI